MLNREGFTFHNGNLNALFDYEDNFLFEVDYFNPDFCGKELAEFANEKLEKIIRIQHCSITFYHVVFFFSKCRVHIQIRELVFH